MSISEPKTSVHSSKGKLLVTSVDARSYRWLKMSNSSSALRMKSSGAVPRVFAQLEMGEE